MEHSWMIRSLIVAGVVLAATPARAGDPYPTELVARAPYLPRGMGDVSATTTITDEDRYGVTATRLTIAARRSFGVVEPFVEVLGQREGAEPLRDLLTAVDLGVRVPVTCRSDVRASVGADLPANPAIGGSHASLTFEGRQPLIAHTLAISGAVGASAYTVRYQARPDPVSPPEEMRTTGEAGFVRGAIEVQPGPQLALYAGLELNVEHWRNTPDLTTGTRPNAIYTLGFVATTRRIDVGASLARSKDGYLDVFVFAATVTARF
jgi:hypothetical protein